MAGTATDAAHGHLRRHRFSSGLPLFLLLNLLPAWLRPRGSASGKSASSPLIQFPYTWKFLWSPLVDRYALPLLGRRRGWMLITQILLALAIAGIGVFRRRKGCEPSPLRRSPSPFSATQDIVLDAYRRELLLENEVGLGSAVYVNAYKIAGLVPGSLSLWLADRLPWGESLPSRPCSCSPAP